MKKFYLLVVMCLIVFGAQLVHATPTLYLSDGTNSVTVYDEGPGDFISGTIGVVGFNGSLGVFSINVTTGETYPSIGTLRLPNLNLSSINVSSGAGGTLNIAFTETGFGPLASTGFNVDAGGTAIGTISFESYIDNNNSPFSKAILIGALGPYGAGAFSGSTTKLITPSSTFSISNFVTITHGSGSQSSSFGMQVYPVTSPFCGNGILDSGEQCDDGNNTDGDGCSANCTIEKASIGDYVWNDLNNNGIQEINEPGVAGVTVNLMDCSGTIIASTVTDANGYYSFNDLMPGNYNINVVLPAGAVFSPQDQGLNDAIDSDVNASGTTTCTTLSPLENDMTWDAGLYYPFCGNGILDSGEQCDDGNNTDGDGCNANCLRELFGQCRMTHGSVTVNQDSTYSVAGPYAEVQQPVFRSSSKKVGSTAPIPKYTWGGQIGAPQANDPSYGEMTHSQHNSPQYGSFTFHAGGHSATKPGTQITSVACADPGWCENARCAPFKQIFWDGVGEFENKSLSNPFPGCPVKVKSAKTTGTLHYFKAHAADFGEPGGNFLPGDGPQPSEGLCSWVSGGTDISKVSFIGDTNGVYPPAPGPLHGSKGSQACDECPDYYEIEIHCTTDPASPVIYQVHDYIDRGNIQIHPEVSQQCP